MEYFINHNLYLLSDQQSENVINYKSPHELSEELDEIKKKFKGTLKNSHSNLISLFKFIYQNSVKTQSNNFLNQLYSNCHYLPLLGDLLATHLNTSPYTYEVAPLFSVMELDLAKTLRELFSLDLKSDFITTPGASYGNMMGHYLARELKKIQIGHQKSDDLILYTPLSHYSVEHSRRILGFDQSQMVSIPMNDEYQIEVSSLDVMIKSLLSRKKKIKLIHLTLGTTVLGSFDSIRSILELKEKYKLDVWIHVDAALGGSVIFSTKDDQIKYLDGLSEVDSFAWNLHKLPGSSGAPLQSSLLIVKDGSNLKKVNSLKSGYLYAEDKYYLTEYDMGDKYAQCGRRNDILKAWLLLTFCQDDIRKAFANMKSYHNLLSCYYQLDPRVHMISISPLIINFWYIPKSMREYSFEDILKYKKDLLTEYTNEIKSVLVKELDKPILIAVQAAVNPVTMEKMPKSFRLIGSNNFGGYQDVMCLVKTIIEVGDQIDQKKLKNK